MKTTPTPHLRNRPAGHVQRRDVGLPMPHRRPLIAAACLLALLVANCGDSPVSMLPSDLPSESDSQQTDPRAPSTRSRSDGTTQRPEVDSTDDSFCSSIDWRPEEIPTFPTECLFQPPHDDWHPTHDEEHEWELGWYALPHPLLDDRGRVIQGRCDENASMIDVCFGRCLGGLNVEGTGSPAYPQGNLHSCMECFERYVFLESTWFWHPYGSSGPAACGMFRVSFRCEEVCCDERIESDFPRRYWEHLYIEWDNTTTPPSVAGCWFRLPGPRVGRDGVPHRPAWSQDRIDEYYERLEAARALEEAGSMDSEPSDSGSPPEPSGPGASGEPDASHDPTDPSAGSGPSSEP